jgi:ubiquinone/menaquinone biosynthesis C-methylase UbiE
VPVVNRKPHPKRNERPRKPTSPAAQQKQQRHQKTDWHGVHEWYDRLVGDAGSEFHQQVVIPGVMRLLAPRPRETIIDIACGQGVLCRALAERGVEMTGVDAAPSLIRAARERGPASIRYHVGDARELAVFPPDHFDAAACVLAIQNIHPIQPVCEGVARLLKPSGKFVIVMMHPAFRGPKETSWGWDQAANVQFRRVDRYLLPRKTPITTHPGSAPDVYTWSFHKPLEAYVKALRNAELLIDALEEWASHKTSEAGPRAAAENAARKEIPMFLALRAVKVPKPLDRAETDRV